MSFPVASLEQLLCQHDSGIWVADEDPADGISILRSTNFTDEGVISFSDLAIKAVRAEDRVAKLLRPGDILLERSGGGPKKPVGRVVLFEGDSRPHVFGNFVARLRTNGRCEPSYLFWYLWHFHRQGRTLSYQKQTTGIRNLEYKRFLQQPVPLPSVDEQRRIVDILNHAASIRRLREQAKAKAKELIPALFLDMFGEPTRNVKGLPIARLGDLIKVRSGEFLPAKRMAEGGSYPVYGGNGIAGYHSTYLLDHPVVVIGRVGAQCGNVHLSEPRSWVTDNALYVVECSRELDQKYLAAALRHANLNQYASQSGQPLISGQRIYPVPILVPPVSLQHAFAKRVIDIQATIEQMDRAATAAEQLQAALMARLFADG